MKTEVENIKWPVTFSDIGWIINPCSDQRKSFYFLIVVFYFFPTLNNGCLKCLLTNWMLYCCVYCRLYNNPSIHYTIQKNYKLELLLEDIKLKYFSWGGEHFQGNGNFVNIPLKSGLGLGVGGRGSISLLERRTVCAWPLCRYVHTYLSSSDIPSIQHFIECPKKLEDENDTGAVDSPLTLLVHICLQ